MAVRRKSKRIIDPKLLERKRKQPCVICRSCGGSDPHHVKSKGSGGDDLDTNVISLCRKHHTEIHAIGMNRFSEKYVEVSVWLSINGWTFNPSIHKWRREPIDY